LHAFLFSFMSVRAACLARLIIHSVVCERMNDETGKACSSNRHEREEKCMQGFGREI
jgi:hypothetical protein